MPPGALRLVCLAACAGGLGLSPSAAVAQLPLCTDEADALETNVAAARPVVGSRAAVVVKLKDGRQAPVTDLAVTISPGGPPQALAVPLPGTLSRLDFTLRDAPRTTVRITWTQGEEPGLAVPCAGNDSYVLATGPSAEQLRELIGDVGFAQVLWFQRRKVSMAIAARFEARFQNSGDPAVVFASLHSAANRALAEMPRVRRLSRRYAQRIRRATAPRRLLGVTRALARTGSTDDAAYTSYLRALARADTVSAVTVAGRAYDRRAQKANEPRVAWREAVVAALRAAAVPVPAWVNRVGR